MFSSATQAPLELEGVDASDGMAEVMPVVGIKQEASASEAGAESSGVQVDAPSTSGDSRDYVDMDDVMSDLAEFQHLMIWKAPPHKEHPHLPTSTWRHSASIIASVCPSPGPSSSSGSSHSLTTSSRTGSPDLRNGQIAVCRLALSQLEEDESCSINSESLFSLQQIAGRMISAGYEKRLRAAFDDHAATFIRCFWILNIDFIFDLKDSAVSQDKREDCVVIPDDWAYAMDCIVGILRKMQMQLHNENCGHFDQLKEEYFSAISVVPIDKMLTFGQSACSFTSSVLENVSDRNIFDWTQEHFQKLLCLINMFGALTDGLPTLLAFLSSQTKDSVCKMAEDLTKRLGDTVVRFLAKLYTLGEGELFVGCGGDIHHRTSEMMDYGEDLWQYRITLDLIMVGHGDQIMSAEDLIVRMVEAFKSYLENCELTGDVKRTNEKSFLRKKRPMYQPPGMRQLFILNNVNYMLKRVRYLGIEGDRMKPCQDQIDNYLESYLDECWKPVTSLLQASRYGFPKLLRNTGQVGEFSSAFESIYEKQKLWKVRDPRIREMLRAAIHQKVVPLYQKHLDKHFRKSKGSPFCFKGNETSNIGNETSNFSLDGHDNLECQIQDMFEG